MGGFIMAFALGIEALERFVAKEQLRRVHECVFGVLALESEPVDILANDTLIARGQVVVQDERYGIRVTEITSRLDRIKSLT